MADRQKPVRAKAVEGYEDYDDIRELETALAINEYALNEERAKNPELFYRVAKAYALTMSRRDAAKQALADAEARADLAFREEAQGANRKITEGEVRATVLTSPSVDSARRLLARLNEEVGQLGALKEAYEDRSYALKDLINLYVANYYGAMEPSAARAQNADEARRKMSEARRNG